MGSPPRELRMKVCVVGTTRVGKSSLIRRFASGVFHDAYVPTVGADISKATLDVKLPGSAEPWQVVLMVWDIVGDKHITDLVQEAYFRQASGVLAVADLTRPETFEEMNGWVGAVREIAGDVPVVIAGNKLDTVDFRDLDWSPLASTATRFSAPLLPTSAKTGDNVQVAFSMVARLGLARDLAGTRPPA